MFEYKATILKIVDGDTVDVTIDLGLKVYTSQRIRLYGINAPEMRTPEGPAAQERLAELMPIGSEVAVKTIKDKTEKFGRYLGLFFDSDGRQINQQMIDEGHAVPYLP